MFVCGVIVDNDVDGLLARHSGVDDIEETDELLMARTLHALADHLAFKNVEGPMGGVRRRPGQRQTHHARGNLRVERRNRSNSKAKIPHATMRRAAPATNRRSESCTASLTCVTWASSLVLTAAAINTTHKIT